MERTLYLNQENYPEDFRYIEGIAGKAGGDETAYVEQQIREAMNAYNGKWQITAIRYCDLASRFPEVKQCRGAGVIAEENEDGEAIVQYVFVSPSTEGARNSLVSQTIFPAYIDYMETYLDSPSYTVANHPFLFLNIMNKQITANMVLRQLTGLILMDMDYVEVFQSSLEEEELPEDLKQYLQRYDAEFGNHYQEAADFYAGKYYHIDFAGKLLTIKTAELTGCIRSTPAGNSFYGSGEKFYLMEMLPMVFFAWKQGFRIDYTEYAQFCEDYKGTFTARSDKFRRCEVLLKYFQKYVV